MNKTPKIPEKIRCVVVGDSKIGKTSLLMTYSLKTFPMFTSQPLDYTISTIKVKVDGYKTNIELYDTHSDIGSYDERTSDYDLADVFLVCFSHLNSGSLWNIRDKWIHEIKEYNPYAKILLVGLRSDLIELKEFVDNYQLPDDIPDSIPLEDILNIKQEIGAVKYLDCSSLKYRGVNKLFREAIRSVTGSTPKVKKNKNCTIL
eukprot:TRINITY_DN1603_c0_g1_i1.p1 TRINITY_DN1603_c0_g1~~TRINITY_DN1603_c0_g1_i1.p1  ORF type:complete len:203 (+),score=53.74 TRINITY_DN1603_c0_g1_i1:41-649(+)